MRSLIKTLAVLAIVTASSAAVRGSPFDSRQVPSDTQWVIHVDFDALRSSKTWAMYTPALEVNPQYQTFKAMLKIWAGIDFPNGVHDVTIYALTIKPVNDGVVLVHATMDHEKILVQFKSDSGNTVEHHGDHDYYIWNQHDKPVCGAFASQDLAVVAKPDLLDHALATLDGKNPPLAASSNLNDGAKPGILFYLASGSLASARPSAPILKHVTSGWLSIGEETDQLMVRASMIADSPNTAIQVAACILGIKATVALSAGNDNPAVGILDAMTCNVQDARVRVALPIPLSLVAQQLKDSGVSVPDFLQFAPDKSASNAANPGSGDATTRPAN
jgi:hypothetical protein